jgi:hypothetical protein
MRLMLHIDDKSQAIEIPENILSEGADYFDMMDADMDKGWQMSREWISSPDRQQRLQIAADKMLNALNAENENLLLLMAGYVLSRAPTVTEIHINTEGEMQETEIVSS